MNRRLDGLAGLGVAAVLLASAGCAAARAGVLPSARPSAGPPPPAPPPRRAAVAPAAPACLTMADGELACTRRCAPLQPAVARCARALAPDPEAPTGYPIRVEGTSSGTGPIRDVRIRLPAGASANLETVAACLRRAFRRYVPCTTIPAGQKTTVLLRLVPPAPR